MGLSFEGIDGRKPKSTEDPISGIWRTERLAVGRPHVGAEKRRHRLEIVWYRLVGSCYTEESDSLDIIDGGSECVAVNRVTNMGNRLAERQRNHLRVVIDRLPVTNPEQP